MQNLSKSHPFFGPARRTLASGAIRVVNAFAAAWFGAALIAAPLGAQTQTQTQDITVPKSAAELLKASGKAAEAASEAKIGAGAKITYAQILADPDNIELNFQYAKNQAADGDLRGAAGMLERILLINPKLLQVRLIYAIVLFRLDNINEAEREFRAVSGPDVSPNLRAEIARYLERIEQRRRRTRYSAQISFGPHYDSNRNASPTSGRRLFLDFETVVTGDDEKSHDWAWTGIGNLTVRHDPGLQAKHELFASLTYFHDEQVTLDTQDLQSASLEGGVKIPLPNDYSFTPAVFASNLRLSREHFYSSLGVGVRIDKKVTPQLEWFFEGRFTDENFHGISETTAAVQRNGYRYDYTLSGNYTISPVQRVGLTYVWTEKHAARNFNAYIGQKATVSYTRLMDRGQFLLASVTGTIDDYRANEAAISDRSRFDRALRHRLTYGAPLGNFIQEDWFKAAGGVAPYEFFKDMTVTVTAELFHQLSTLTNYEYQNRRLQGLVTKKWDF